MRKGKKPRSTAPPPSGAGGPSVRADELLRRLETNGVNPVQAAEELDRLQPSLARAGADAEVRDRVADLCAAWAADAAATLRGDRARAWLVLVGAFSFPEHAEEVASLARDSGLPARLRIQAFRALAALDPAAASPVLQEVLLSPADPAVRAAAAEALVDTGDRTARPVLEALLDEDLPRSLWQAVSQAADRLA
jgi:HEAT repeat protein